ncbi:chlorohydrolase [Planctomycetales bacterium]|nr:chlorohydrolase [Planctomycetales bacterium]GHT37892.1 chlorohydrolase [Planctomycetales bacterium]
MPQFNNSRYSIGAGLIYTMTGKTLENHFVNVVENRIDAFTTYPTQENVYDFGEHTIVLPGTINMHTHLELSQLKKPFDVPLEGERRSFASWVEALLQFRRSEEYNAASAIWNSLLRRDILSESIAVADIMPLYFPLNEFHQNRPKQPRLFPFAELIGWNSGQVENQIAEVKLAALQNKRFYGLSPHAPHTVCPALLEFAVRQNVPVAMHLAESPEEMQLLENHSGKLLDLIRKVDENYNPQEVLLSGSSPACPMDYLRLLADAPKAFIIHGNYLNDEELKFLAERRETMAIVYCPRSHQYFSYAPYPLKKMLDFGVNVLLGTDSIASSPDLSMLNEIHFVRQLHPEVPAETIFSMATFNSAVALEIENEFGTLELGRPARFSFYNFR